MKGKLKKEIPDKARRMRGLVVTAGCAVWFGLVPIEPVLAQQGNLQAEAVNQRDPQERARQASLIEEYSPEAVEQLVEFLKDEDRHVRLSALEALSNLGMDASSAVQAVLPLTGSTDPRVRGQAVDTLYRISPLGPKELSDVLLRELRNPKAAQQLQAATRLYQMWAHRDKAVDIFVELLTHPDPSIRASASNQLGETGRTRPKILAALSHAARDPIAEVRAAALLDLAKLSASAEVVQMLEAALGDNVAAVREAAVEALAVVAESATEASAALARVATSTDSSTRSKIIESLKQLVEGDSGIDESSVIPVLAGALNDESEAVRIAASEALGGMQESSPAAILALKGALNDPSPQVRTAVVKTLGLIPTENQDIASLLISKLQEDSPFVRRAAATALGEVGQGSAVISAIRTAMMDDEGWVRETAAQAAGEIIRRREVSASDKRSLLEGLRLVLDNDDEDVVLAGLKAVRQFAPAEADVLSATTTVFESVSHYVRLGVIETLGSWCNESEAATDSLAAYTAHTDPQIRSAAFEALQNIDFRPINISGLRSQVSGWVLMLSDDPDAERTRARARARSAMESSLDGMPHKVRLLETLRTTLDDNDDQVQRVAVSTFGELLRGAVDWVQKAQQLPETVSEQNSHRVFEQLVTLNRLLRPSFDQLSRQIEHPNEEVRRATAEILGTLEPFAERAAEVLSGAVDDPSGRVRQAAVEAFGELGSGAAPQAGALAEALADGNEDVRLATLKSLRQVLGADEIGEKATSPGSIEEDTVARLGRAIHDSSPEVRKETIETLSHFAEKRLDVSTLLLSALERDSSELHVPALRALGKQYQPGKEVIDALRSFSADSDWQVRLAATLSLRDIGQHATPALADLIARLSDPVANTRVAAAQALAYLRTAAAPAGPSLTDRLSDPKVEVRIAAIEALGWVGPPSTASVSKLVPLLHDEDLRTVTATALVRIGTGVTDALQGVEPATPDADETIATILNRVSESQRQHSLVLPTLQNTVEDFVLSDNTVAVNVASWCPVSEAFIDWLFDPEVMPYFREYSFLFVLFDETEKTGRTIYNPRFVESLKPHPSVVAKFESTVLQSSKSLAVHDASSPCRGSLFGDPDEGCRIVFPSVFSHEDLRFSHHPCHWLTSEWFSRKVNMPEVLAELLKGQLCGRRSLF